MTDVSCSRCGSKVPALERPPLPGKYGEMVQQQTCPACWREWVAMQVKVMNEYRLSPSNPQQFDYLIGQMKAFLNLQEAS